MGLRPWVPHLHHKLYLLSRGLTLAWKLNLSSLWRPKQHGPLMWRKCFNQSYKEHKNSEHSLHRGTRYTLHPPPTPPLLLPWGPSQERTTLTTNNVSSASKLPWGRFGAATVFKYYVCVGLNNPTVQLPRRCVYRTAARLTITTLSVTTVTRHLLMSLCLSKCPSPSPTQLLATV